MTLASLFARLQTASIFNNVVRLQIDERACELKLPGGRLMSYAGFGAGDGPLVVVLDGPGSRGLARAAAGAAAELGGRLVTPDGPGFGTSTQVAGDRIFGWPRDHAALLDSLGAQQAGILAQSGGTPCALAAAAALPQRTIAVALLAPVGPLAEPAIRACSGGVLRRCALLARHAPWLLRLGVKIAGRQARRNPERAAAKFAADLPPVDAAIIREPHNWAIHQHSLPELLAHPTTVTGEIARLVRPWGIDYAAISSPVMLWSGDRDEVHPTPQARRLAELLHDSAARPTGDAASTSPIRLPLVPNAPNAAEPRRGTSCMGPSVAPYGGGVVRVLVSAVGTRGDVQPAVALALEVRELGHDVRLCVSPNFVDWVAGLGFEATPVGVEMRQRESARGTAAVQTQAELRRIGEDLITDQFDAISCAADGCDVLVGAGGHQYAAPSIAEVHGVPYVNAVYAPVALPSPDYAPPPAYGGKQVWERGRSADNQRRWSDNARAWNDRSLEPVNTNRLRLGLEPVDDVYRHLRTSRPWLAADPVLAPLPRTPGMTVVQTGAWMFADSSSLPAELEDFLGDGEPPIYAGFGSMPASQNTSGMVIEAARAAGRRVILAQGWAELALADDAPDCIATGDVNHQALFPRVAAVVHHGGAGTTTTAARAGVPQIITPMFSDQFYWAQRIRVLGTGAPVASGAATSDLLVALKQALRPAVAQRARSLAAHIATDGAAAAARRLVQQSDEHPHCSS
jgi:vancomycin aglycone glucosyltransferase